MSKDRTGDDRVLVIGDAPGGNYEAAAYRLALTIKKGQVAHAYIHHDTWCGIWQGQACDCDPIVRRDPLPIEEHRVPF